MNGGDAHGNCRTGWILDSSAKPTHLGGMKRVVIRLAVGLAALTTVAFADAIQKWRTPDGSLYFGDRPPAGSTLIETFADTPPAPAMVAPADVASLAQAAADGREIIRRREAERVAEAQRDQEREARLAELETLRAEGDFGMPLFITSTVRPCRVPHRCFPGRRHPGPIVHSIVPGRSHAVISSRTPPPPRPSAASGFVSSPSRRGRIN